jgi:tetratricopeptide (TPR) repeat protein
LRTRAEIVYWKDGETLFERAIVVTKDNFMAHYCLGNAMLTKDPKRHEVEFQKSVDIYPDYFSSQFCLATVLEGEGLHSNALIHFEKAAQLDPKNAWAHHGLGIALYGVGRTGEAIPAFLKAVETAPQNVLYKEDLARILFFGGHHAETASNFLVAARSDPIGFSNFWAAVELDPNQAPLISNLAMWFATNPDPNLRNGGYALRMATRSCEMTGFHTNYHIITLAAAYAENSLFDDAVKNAQLACSLTSAADQPELLQKYQVLLELFRSHQAYHEAVQ